MRSEERAEVCVAALWPGKSARAQNRDLIADAIRAAIAERDREWAKALDAAGIRMRSGGKTIAVPAGGVRYEAGAPLRALLAAGPATERTE